MSLTFGANTSDHVNIPDHASIQLTDASLFTWLIWFRLTTFTANRRLANKNAQDGAGGPSLHLTGTSELFGNHSRDAVNDTATTSGAGIVTGTWYCVGMTYDDTALQHVQIYLGSLSAVMTETAYTAPVNGNGGSASTAPLRWGNNSQASQVLALQGDIAYAAMFNRIVTLGEMQSWQFRPRVLSGCTVFHVLGYNGTSTQPDLSGTGNAGTVDGAIVGDHVPIPFRRARPQHVPYTVVVVQKRFLLTRF